MPQPPTVVVIGGGISGLSCAYRLRQLDIPVILFEASPRAGGLMETVERDGFLFESGPQSFQGTPLLMQLIRELKLEGELCQGDARAPRYILRHGRMQKISMSPQALLAGSFLGPKSRWKIASEPFRRTKPPSEDESIANFVRRKFGNEILEYLVSPFVSGVYAGDPEKLSLRAAFPSLEEWERQYGSVLRGAMKSRKASASTGPPPLCSFRRGTVTLTSSLAAALDGDVKTAAPVQAVLPGKLHSPGYEVRLEEKPLPDGSPISAAAVVLAAPAYAASHIVRPLNNPLADTLSGIAYASVAVFAAGYYAKQAIIPPDGFGVLIPRSEKHRALGIIWNSSLFPGRAPEGQFTITSFLGGATDPGLLDESDNEIAAIAEKDISTILGITGQPITSALWRHPKAIPQYNLGHGHIVESLRSAERSLPGLFFAGNYLAGPSIGKCVENAFKTGEAVRDHLNNAQSRATT
jgi:oxygen-dependent protoporphyrinogen oxidase